MRMAKKQVPIQPKTSSNNSSSGYGVKKPNHTSCSSYSTTNNHSPLSSAASSTSSPLQNNAISDHLILNSFVNDMPLIPDSSALPRPKILKSCIRCRKHKTKCDASEQAPNPCSSCAKRKIPCKIDYVLPPQRYDNLKNLVGQVKTIRTNYEQLEDYYTKISQKLSIKIESFEQWKAKNKPEVVTDSENKDEEEEEYKNSYNLIKLSDGSFISMSLIEENQILINNKIIEIDEFQAKLNKLSARLSYLFQTTKSSATSKSSPNVSQSPILTPEDESNHSSTDDNSSIASPISVLNNIGTVDVVQENISGGAGLCQSDTGIDLPQNISNLQNFTPLNLDNSTITSEFDVFDLKLSVLELFKSNKFLLILLIGFYYPDTYNPINSLNYNLFLSDYLNSYYQIIDNQNKASNSSTYSSFLINSIPGYHLIFNKDQLKDLIDCEIFNSEAYLKKLIQILFLNVLLYGLDDRFKILKDFIKFVEKNINSNRKKINFDKTDGLKFIDNYIKLFDTFENVESRPKSSSTTIIENFKHLLKLDLSFTNEHHLKSIGFPRSHSLFNPSNPSTVETGPLLHSMKISFKRFITHWSNYFQMYESEVGLFIDDFIIETFIINCLIFINEGHQDFNSTLLQFLTNYKVNNENICELIEFFKTKDEEPKIEHFNFSCSQFQHIIMNLILNKKNIIDLRINDIQVILENVDWKTESPDDVLKKIGVI